MVDAEKKKQKELGKASRKSLRVMRKTRNKNVVRNGSRIMKYGVKGFGRNFWLSAAAIAIMITTLVVLFATVVVSVILNDVAQSMKDTIDITVYFEPETSDEALKKLSERISEDENIKAVETSSAKDEYEKVKAYYENKAKEKQKDNKDVQNVMDWDEMKDGMTSKLSALMRIWVYDIDNLDSVKEIVEKDELFEKYRDKVKDPTYDTKRKEINAITTWANIARTGGIVLAVAFLAISVLIIFSTIRMAIFSRREEIYMMKLVGADKSFIRGPFLVEAEICGLIAGVVAGTISYFGFKAITPWLEECKIDIEQINNVLQSNQLVLVFLAFIAAGVFIGWLSARLAVSKYLRKT